MGFWENLLALFRGRPRSERYLPIYVLDHRCHEPLAGQIDLMNELSLDDEEGSGYFVRKVLHTSGAGRCFGQVEVQVWLNPNKEIVRQVVQGGRWLTKDEYVAHVGKTADSGLEESNSSSPAAGESAVESTPSSSKE